MQTIKTGAVVVLLMTFVFSAYTSLTTAPEELPDEYAELLFEEGAGDFAADFNVDDGLPPSLMEGLPAGDPDATALAVDAPAATPSVTEGPGVDLASPRALGTPIENAPPEIGALDFALGTPVGDSPPSEAVSMNLSDRPPAELTDGVGQLASASTRRFSDRLPPPDAPAATPGGYPTTPHEFLLPDPAPKKVAPPEPSGASVGFDNALRTADTQYADGRLKDALATLSLFYTTPGISESQRAELLRRLDPLAGAVIYSRQHLIQAPHRVAENETLMQIAERYRVPWQVLASINAVRDPVSIEPGTELKIVRGPFRGEVDARRGELTLFVGDLYAGRFPVIVGRNPTPAAGSYTVQDKQTARTFYDQTGSAVPAGDPQNPYGSAWLDLGGDVCLHGSPLPTQATDAGCISPSGEDARDVFGILSLGSTVMVR